MHKNGNQEELCWNEKNFSKVSQMRLVPEEIQELHSFAINPGLSQVSPPCFHFLLLYLFFVNLLALSAVTLFGFLQAEQIVTSLLSLKRKAMWAYCTAIALNDELLQNPSKTCPILTWNFCPHRNHILQWPPCLRLERILKEEQTED